jgi:hypothetical protein
MTTFQFAGRIIALLNPATIDEICGKIALYMLFLIAELGCVKFEYGEPCELELLRLTEIL